MLMERVAAARRASNMWPPSATARRSSLHALRLVALRSWRSSTCVCLYLPVLITQQRSPKDKITDLPRMKAAVWHGAPLSSGT
mmetsp:Transcript_42611/g.96327  ORF Transcript_42611/g.96327 Transcript_42611/m.96327 type:complete len:83 (-) Transcript_42611:471-719(-)